MPYIESSFRLKFHELTKELGELASTPGELNYIITAILHYYTKKSGISYSKLNEIIGVIECCKHEFYRRIISPYENLKIISNGDIGIVQDTGLELDNTQSEK